MTTYASLTQDQLLDFLSLESAAPSMSTERLEIHVDRARRNPCPSVFKLTIGFCKETSLPLNYIVLNSCLKYILYIQSSTYRLEKLFQNNDHLLRIKEKVEISYVTTIKCQGHLS